MSSQQDTNPLQVQLPPPGLNKAKRRDWEAQEGRRIARIQDEQVRSGWRVLASTPPRGLGSAGRRAWMEAHRANRARWFGEETGKDKDNRAVGAFVLLLIVVIGAVAYYLLGGHHSTSRSPQLPNLGAASTSTYIPPSPDPSVIVAPEYVALRWLEATCGSTPDDPAPARFARNKDLMTPAAYTALSTEVPLVGWTCVQISTSIEPDQLRRPDDQIVTLHATINPLDGGRGRPTEAKRLMLRQPDGHWLIGPVIGE